jgi:hypothetical protein
VWGKGSKLGEPYPQVRLSQDRLSIEPFACMKSYVRGKGSKLGEPFPKVRLSQDRLPIKPSFFLSLSLALSLSQRERERERECLHMLPLYFAQMSFAQMSLNHSILV